MVALTIGMATYNDFDGVYFTLQALRLYHDLTDTELLVVDNYGCEHTERFVAGWAQARYVRATDVQGTAAPRERVFAEARGEAVLCCDSHVLFAPGAIARLKTYYRDHPGTPDLLQGPMLADDLESISTHQEPVWSNEMWGIRGTDPRGVVPEGEPFEIPMQGLGVFSCRRAAWPGFPPAFRGFGGEEGYLHEKVRQRGGRCLCLPWLRWGHRFGRPQGVPYKLKVEDKLWNFVIGHAELGLDLAPVLEHFAQHLPEKRVAAIADEALRKGIGAPHTLVLTDTASDAVPVSVSTNRAAEERVEVRPTTGVVLYVVGHAAEFTQDPAVRRLAPVALSVDESETSFLARVRHAIDVAIAEGGTHLLVPRENADWLGDHPLLVDYFAQQYELVEASVETGLVFSLRPSANLDRHVQTGDNPMPNHMGLRSEAQEAALSSCVAGSSENGAGKSHAEISPALDSTPEANITPLDASPPGAWPLLVAEETERATDLVARELPLVSCICATYNRSPSHQHLLEEAIESFLRQTYPNKELLVLNDCPGQELVCDAPGVRVINMPERFPSLGEKHNSAIGLARGDLIAMWDDDDISLPWRLSLSVERLCDADYFNPKRFWMMSRDEFRPDPKTNVGHNLSLYRRTAFEAVGGYPSIGSGVDAALDQAFRRQVRCVGSELRSQGGLAYSELYYIYRWGVSPAHLSASGKDSGEKYERVGARPIQPGRFHLLPHWRKDYLAETRRLIENVCSTRSLDNVATLPDRAELGDPASYPAKVAVGGPNRTTLEMLRESGALMVAEVGIFEGRTSEAIVRLLDGKGVLHLFDYADKVERVATRLHNLGYRNVVGHGNSYKSLDSYNWSLMRLLEKDAEPIFDYVLIDGAHSWAHDALAFLLVDRLLKPGGYVDFDDYGWSFAVSPSLSPKVFPRTAELYTEEQIQERQVALVVNLLVRRDRRYTEVVNNKIFRKLTADSCSSATSAGDAATLLYSST